MTDVALALGSNLGDSRDCLSTAARAIADLPETHLVAASNVYRTPPWGVTDQPDFLNACILIETGLEPEDLLAACKGLERAAGRQRGEKWGPRTLDIDILWYGTLEQSCAHLILPHPHMLSRGFVLVPLADIAPDMSIAGKSIAVHAARFADEPILPVGPLLAQPQGYRTGAS